MAELKTKVTAESVAAFLAKVPTVEQRADAKKLAALLRSVTKQKPKMWGTSIVGFDQYHYKSERSAQEGFWPMIGFSPRKQNLTIYLMGGAKKHAALLKKLGPHATSNGSCLYLKRLEGIDMSILKKILIVAYVDMKKKHKSK